jgi:hypothetical protein
MLYKVLALIALLTCAAVSPLLAADRMRLVSIPLDLPLSDDGALDNQALEGLYQGDYCNHMTRNVGGYLGDRVKSSGLNESPFYHIDTVLKDNYKLDLWFSSASDGRKTFGVHLEMMYTERPTASFKQTLAELESAWGKPNVQLSSLIGKGAQQILIYADRMMPKENYDKVIAELPAADKISPKDRDNLWRSDLREWTRLLGANFRGAIAIVTDQDGKLARQQIVLIDLVRARSVFNLDQGK